ncbi:hypothetical protein [Streptomyces sp. NPDC005438]|uniref:hypothetical protein n=1 Tax=Streptomyces sp. NPDC005438 TaxID=3156880 RepID=UPI0033A36AB5
MSPDRPDGRTPPDGGSRSCRLDRARTRGGDGQPTTIHVARTGGAHVTAADVRWMHDRLDPREDQ